MTNQDQIFLSKSWANIRFNNTNIEPCYAAKHSKLNISFEWVVKDYNEVYKKAFPYLPYESCESLQKYGLQNIAIISTVFEVCEKYHLIEIFYSVNKEMGEFSPDNIYRKIIFRGIGKISHFSFGLYTGIKAKITKNIQGVILDKSDSKCYNIDAHSLISGDPIVLYPYPKKPD